MSVSFSLSVVRMLDNPDFVSADLSQENDPVFPTGKSNLDDKI